jgi:DNA-binding PadR family transcriptional regulator
MAFRRIELSRVIVVGYDPAVSSRDSDMTPQMMVLGTVAMGAGTVPEIQRRLVERWPAAAFPRNAAHSNLPRLEALGYVRVVEVGEDPREKPRYAIQEAGWMHLREWVGLWPPDPTSREAIHAKTHYAKLTDLPEIVRMVRAQQLHCEEESDIAQTTLLREQRLQGKSPPRDRAEKLRAALKTATLKDQTLYWGDLAARRKMYGDDLEEIYRRFLTSSRLADEGE